VAEQALDNQVLKYLLRKNAWGPLLGGQWCRECRRTTGCQSDGRAGGERSAAAPLAPSFPARFTIVPYRHCQGRSRRCMLQRGVSEAPRQPSGVPG
jgi:hypothetical protein